MFLGRKFWRGLWMGAALGILVGCQAMGPAATDQNGVSSSIPVTTPSAESALYAQKAIELYGEVITKTRRDGVAEAFRAQKQNPKRHEDLFMDPLALMGKPKGKAS